MAQYGDNPIRRGSAHDVNKDNDNYWVFTTDKKIGVKNPNDQLQGYQFSPISSYNTNVVIRDGDEDGLLSSHGLKNNHTNDGIVINKYTYEISRHWNFSATLNYQDGSSIKTTVLVSRLVKDRDSRQGAGELHGKAIIRFHDANIPGIIGGESGTGKYTLSDIESIQLGRMLGRTSIKSRNITSSFDGDIPLYPKKTDSREINHEEEGRGESNAPLKAGVDEARPEAKVDSISNRTAVKNNDTTSSPLCFAEDTLIETEMGRKPVTMLRPGDLVLTYDDGYQPILWIGGRHVPAEELAANPNLRPIRIAKGALGSHRPFSDLIISPQHRVLIASHWARELFGSDEILVPAKKLTGLPGIEIAEDIETVDYYHILLDFHHIIWSNGAATESLYLGTQSLNTLTSEGQKEVASLFGDPDDIEGYMVPARKFIYKRNDLRQLLGREE